MNGRILILFLAIIASLARAAEPLSTNISDKRFLFILDTSSSMSRSSNAINRVVMQLLGSSMEGEMREGDTFGIWNFSSKLHANFPAQRWMPAYSQTHRERAADFLTELRYEGRSSLNTVVKPMMNLIRSSKVITIVLVTDGQESIRGTSVDREINDAFKEYGRQLREDHIPFVTFLAARGGAIIGYSVASALGPFRIPKAALPSPPPAPRTAVIPPATATNRPPAVAAAKPTNAPVVAAPVPPPPVTNTPAAPPRVSAIATPPALNAPLTVTTVPPKVEVPALLKKPVEPEPPAAEVVKNTSVAKETNVAASTAPPPSNSVAEARPLPAAPPAPVSTPPATAPTNAPTPTVTPPPARAAASNAAPVTAVLQESRPAITNPIATPAKRPAQVATAIAPEPVFTPFVIAMIAGIFLLAVLTVILITRKKRGPSLISRSIDRR
jgi:hypothetical protein